MSGTGKSTVIAALAARGYRAIDADSDEWSHWVTIDDPTRSDGAEVQPVEEPDDLWGNRDWVWREDRIRRLLSGQDAGGDAGMLFVSGCAANQGQFYPQFDYIILLSAPAPVLMERLATRTTNAYGKLPEELVRILGHIETVEPRLRRSASFEVDTSAPIEQVVDTILSAVLH